MTSALAIGGRSFERLLAGPDTWRWVAITAFLALGIGLRSPWPADEPRFALAALDMVTNGHWLLPHRGGEIYADKPPVFMWLQGISYLLTGNMRVAFLLPSLLASLVTLVLVHDLTRRMFGREAAWFAVLLLLVTVQFETQARSGQIDATLCAFTTLGLYGLVRHLHLGPGPGWYAAGWLAMGVGIITKGVGFLPVFAIPGLLAVRFFRRPNTQPYARPRLSTVCLPVLMLLPAALWLLPLVVEASVHHRADVTAYLNEILFRQTVTRYADGLGHTKPAWYYVLNVIPGLWLPFSFLFIWLVPDWVRRLREWSVAHWMLLSYLALGLLFFSVSPGKRGVYLLPLLPAVAILSGPGLQRLRGLVAPVRGLRIAVLLVGLLLMSLAAATSFDLGPLSEQLERAELAVLPAMAFLLAAGSLWTVSAMMIRSGGAFSVAMIATWVLFSTWGYVLLDPVRSAADLMKEVAAHTEPTTQVAIVGFREQQLLQADRDIVHWSYHDNLRAQAVAAAEWLRAAPKRRLLIAASTASDCFDRDAGISLGFRHRRDWRLVSARDISDGADCVAPAAAVTEYRAAWLAYPEGIDDARAALGR